MSEQFHRRMPVVVAFFSSLFASGALQAEPEDRLPRYHLQVGQEFVYRGESELRYSDGKQVWRDAWHVWVVRANADGGWRLLLRRGHSFSVLRTEKNEETKAAPDKPLKEKLDIAWCDILPNGRIVDGGSSDTWTQPARLLPRLPENLAEANGGWASKNPAADETLTFKMRRERSADQILIEQTAESPQHATFGIDEKTVITFDVKRGVPESMTTVKQQAFAPKGKGEGKLELIEVKSHTEESSRLFADEAERFFTALTAYDNAMQRKDLTGDALQSLFADAANEFRKAGEALQSAELKEQIAAKLQIHDALAKEEFEFAELREKLVGKPSVEWSTTDLDGKPHSLKDYRGKVVVLDFWYRGCGNCILGMPQIKHVAAHFQDRPVAVLGMNDDQKVENAKFVVEKLALNYPNLKAIGFAEKKYGIGWAPALLIIDQQGIVREVHAGYSPTLGREVIHTVDELLRAKS